MSLRKVLTKISDKVGQSRSNKYFSYKKGKLLSYMQRGILQLESPQFSECKRSNDQTFLQWLQPPAVRRWHSRMCEKSRLRCKHLGYEQGLSLVALHWFACCRRSSITRNCIISLLISKNAKLHLLEFLYISLKKKKLSLEVHTVKQLGKQHVEELLHLNISKTR